MVVAADAVFGGAALPVFEERCTRWCSAKQASVLKRVDLSTLSSTSSKSAMLNVSWKRFIVLYMSILTDVGRIPWRFSISSGSCLSLSMVWFVSSKFGEKSVIFFVPAGFSGSVAVFARPGAQDIVKYGFLQPFVLSCFRPIPLSVGPDGVWRGVRGLSRCSLNGLQFRRMNRVSAFSVRITASMLKKKMRFPVHRYRKIVYLLLVFLMSEK